MGPLTMNPLCCPSRPLAPRNPVPSPIENAQTVPDIPGLSFCGAVRKARPTPATSQTPRGTTRRADTGLQEPTATHSFSVPSPPGSEDASRWQGASQQTKPLCVEGAGSLLGPLSRPRNV